MPSGEGSTTASDPVSVPGPRPAIVPGDQITPHRLTTVLLIREFSLLNREKGFSTGDRIQFCLLSLGLIQSPDLPLSTAVDRVVRAVPSLVARKWVGCIRKLQEEGVAGIMDLVQSIEKLLTGDASTNDQALVNRSSVIGLMLRSIYLYFDKLTFSEVSQLRQIYTHYYQAGECRLKDVDSDSSVDMCMDGDKSADDYKLPSVLPTEFQKLNVVEDIGKVSRKQADLFIAMQANLIETNESEAYAPKELQQHVKRILRSNPDLSEAHYLSFLNCMRVKEVVGAMDSLYASFNQAVIEFVASGKQSQEEINKGFRTAALNLAALHARLGHREEALSAIKEAITMAQEANDHVCLQHALSWLCRVSPADKERLLEKCISKCGDLHLDYLSSLGIQAFSQLQHSNKPAAVFELLARSDVLNAKNSIVELLATSYVNKAAVWASYGRAGLSSTLSQLLLQLNTSDPSRGGKVYSGEAIAIALSNVSLALASYGYSNACDKLLAKAESLFPVTRSQHCRIWQMTRSRILFQRAISSADWTVAETAVESLSSLEAPDAGLALSELYFHQGHVTEARSELEPIISSQSVSSDVRTRAWLLLADIHCLSGDPAGAIPHLTSATSLAADHRHDHLHCLAVLQLAHCQLLLGCPARAYQLTLRCLAPILAHGSLVDCSRARLLAAKCRIAASGDLNNAEKRAELLEGSKMLTEAREGFEKAGAWSRVKDCLYILARLYHGLQLDQERNLAAQEYKKLDEIYPTRTAVHLAVLI